jgi:hypothetical protein
MSEEDKRAEAPSEEQGSIFAGLAFCWAANVGQLIIGILLLTTGTILPVWLIGGVGLIQLAYVIPLYQYFKSNGRSMSARGLVIAASITALLNAACWGSVYGRF